MEEEEIHPVVLQIEDTVVMEEIIMMDIEEEEETIMIIQDAIIVGKKGILQENVKVSFLEFFNLQIFNKSS